MTKTIHRNNMLYIYSALSPSRVISSYHCRKHYKASSTELPYRQSLATCITNTQKRNWQDLSQAAHTKLLKYCIGTCKVRKAIYDRESSERYNDMLRRVLLLLLGNKYQEAEVLLPAVITHRKTGMERCKEELNQYRDSLKYYEDKLLHYRNKLGYHNNKLGEFENEVKYYQDKVKRCEEKLEQYQERYHKSVNALGDALAGQHKHNGAVDVY
jgi:hypothetical protein